MHNVVTLGISVQKSMIFLRQRLQATPGLCKGHHILVQLRVALVLIMDGQSLRE